MRDHRFLTILVAVACLATPIAAQNPTGSVSGHVTSAEGALPGVTVSVSSPSLLGTRTTTTSANGDYIHPLLPPGSYKVTFALEGFTTLEQDVKVSIGQASRVDAEMSSATITEEILVQSSYENVSSTTQAAVTLEKEVIQSLPVARTIRDTALLAPAVSDTGPGRNITIAGAQSYESLFLVNGVVVTENIRGQPFNLFIEDAIEETTVSASGISAEYGRFAGGVVDTITKSGGNDLQGSFRTSFDNQKWSSETEKTTVRRDKVNDIYEATLGGYVWKDHIWYFLAGRDFERVQNAFTDTTLVPFPDGADEQRFEAKLTLAPNASHRLVASYLENDRTELGNRFGRVLDTASINNRELPQEVTALHYTGVLTSNFFIEGQYSEREFSFVGSGSRFTDRIKGTLLVDDTRGVRWWSPTFCGVCIPEGRDNDNALVKASYFLSTAGMGSHDLVLGYDTFSDIRAADNHQSGSDFRFTRVNTVIQGSGPSAQLYLQFLPNIGRIQWNPILVSTKGSDFQTNSIFLNDRWSINDHWSLNLGVRYDENDGKNQEGKSVIKDSRISPRLGVTFDPRGDGEWVFNASLSRYVAAIANSQADASSAAGNPATYVWQYRGPAINPTGAAPISTEDAIAQIFAWFESTGGTANTSNLISLNIPGATVALDDGLGSPYTDEWSVGVVKRLGGSGLLRADLVHREAHDFYMQRGDLSTGTVLTPTGSRVDFSVVENDDKLLERTYDGVHLFGTARIRKFDLLASYTLSRLEGNVDGETGPNGPVRSVLLQYPEYRGFAAHNPDGDLLADQRHRARLAATWHAIETQHHSLSVGVLQNYWSGTPYGAVGSVNPTSYVTNPGYRTPPTSVNYYFTDRDAFRTDDITSTDLAISYSFNLRALGQDIQLFLAPQVINVFDEDGVVVVNTAVQDATTTAGLTRFNPFTETPVEGVHWRKGVNFGKPTLDTDFQTPRTFRFSVGVRF